MNNYLPDELVTRFATIVGEGNALSEPEDKAAYLEENRGIF